MHSFHYQSGHLNCEEVPLSDLAQTYGTPLYVYSQTTVLDHFNRLSAALAPLDHEVCYAVKANSNLSLLRMLAEAGAGFDIVSGGELYRVTQSGGNPARCTFAGVGKTEDEIAYALYNDIYCFNIESEPELLAINRVAAGLHKRAPIAVRLNPDVDAKTHHYISTGKKQNKFGIGLDQAEEVYALAAKLDHIVIRGAQIHIGSQITTSEPFADAIQKLVPLLRSLKDRFGLEFFSVGGGLGIVYRNSFASGAAEWWERTEISTMTIADYANAIVPLLQPLGLRILVEPGRLLVGNAGILLTRVLYLKHAGEKNFVIIDAGMNDLIRPALYEGYHEIWPELESRNQKMIQADVVGPICESGDFLALDRSLAAVEPGDLLVVMSAGAYGFSMASNYNSRPLPAEVLVNGEHHSCVRRRQTYADLVELELPPETRE
jgi:diaminopimelate decarboxylase